MKNPKNIPTVVGSASEEQTAAEMIVTEISRHGPRTAAELLAAVGAPSYAVIDAATRLFVARVIRLTEVSGEKRFTLRSRS